MGVRGAPSPGQTDQRCIREHPSFLHAVCHLVKTPSLCFADFSTLPQTMPRSPHPPPPQAGWGVGRRFSSGVPPIQPALSCRCPSRSKSPRRVGSHKRHPQHLARHCVLSSPEGPWGHRGAREGNLCGWGRRSTRGFREDLLRCVRSGGAAGARVHARAPLGARACGAGETAPSDRSSRGHPRTQQSRRQRLSPP